MTRLKIMTFNVENMLVRFNFREWEKERLATLLDVDSDVDRANLIRTHWNVINEENRVATALTMRIADPDVICLQEVENMLSLKSFHDRYLRRISGREYPHMMLIEANDPRGINVAVLSRYRIVSATSHQEIEKDIRYPDGSIRRERVFRRDCLELEIKKDNRILTLFVCHFKSMIGGRQETRHIREVEATTVKEIIEERFTDPSNDNWIIAGDLNDYIETDGTPDNSHGLHPILDNDFSFNLIKKISEPTNRWTHYYQDDRSYHQLDYLLLSPSLRDKNQGTIPDIIRDGQPYRVERYAGNRWPRIGYDRPKASDHCPIVATLDF